LLYPLSYEGGARADPPGSPTRLPILAGGWLVALVGPRQPGDGAASDALGTTEGLPLAVPATEESVAALSRSTRPG
jgi:hypothetical protein